MGTVTSPLVDVIIPTRNRFALTAEAIRSVQAQTWPDWRLFVVDDGSDDDSASRLKTLARADVRILVVERARSGGAQAARQSGFEAGSAQLVATLDSDDLWEPTKLEKQVQRFYDRSPHLPDLGVVLCWHAWTGLPGTAPSTAARQVRRFVVDGPARPLLTNNMSTPVFLRATLDRIGGFLGTFGEQLRTSEHVELFIRLSEACAFAVVAEQLVRCRTHQQPRASDALGKDRRFADELASVLEKHHAFLSRHPSDLAEMRARVGARYLAVGLRRIGARYLGDALRHAKGADRVRLLREFGPFAVRSVAAPRYRDA